MSDKSVISSKKALEVALSKLLSFENPKVRDEQYQTPSSIAAEVLWSAALRGDLQGKAIADLGCGAGILGIGSMLLGAKAVYFIDSDAQALALLGENLAKLESEHSAEHFILEGDVKTISEHTKHVDTVIMNPPFGTKKKHADREFLEVAFDLSDVTYSYHKQSTVDYLVSFAGKKEMKCEEKFDFSYLLPAKMAHHRRQKHYIAVSCLVFRKSKRF